MQKRLILILSLISFVFLFGCAQQQPRKAIIKDLTVDELEGDRHKISFFIANNDLETRDCQARMFFNNDLYGIYDLGMIKPDERKFFETTINYPEGRIDMNVIPDCKELTQEETNACGNNQTDERRLCMLTFNNTKLQKCLANDALYYKLFCIALISKNPEICAYIAPDAKKMWCKAYITKDASFCNNIQSEEDKNLCYIDIGMNYKDETVCNKISDKESKTSCIATATQNPELCLEGAEQHKINCILNIIESTSDKKLCNLLNSEQKKECTGHLEQTK